MYGAMYKETKTYQNETSFLPATRSYGTVSEPTTAVTFPTGWEEAVEWFLTSRNLQGTVRSMRAAFQINKLQC